MPKEGFDRIFSQHNILIKYQRLRFLFQLDFSEFFFLQKSLLTSVNPLIECFKMK